MSADIEQMLGELAEVKLRLAALESRLPPLPGGEIPASTRRPPSVVARDDDALRATVFAALHQCGFTSRAFTTRELLAAAETSPVLRTALLPVAQSRQDPGRLDVILLGIWLSRQVGLSGSGYILTADRRDRRRPRWWLSAW